MCNLYLDMFYFFKHSILSWTTDYKHKGWVKRKVIEVAEKLPEDSWNDFKIVQYEDRTIQGGRPYWRIKWTNLVPLYDDGFSSVWNTDFRRKFSQDSIRSQFLKLQASE